MPRLSHISPYFATSPSRRPIWALNSSNEAKGEIVLNTAARPLKKKKADRIIGAIMLAYHSAKHIAKTEEEREDKFYQLLKRILGDLV